MPPLGKVVLGFLLVVLDFRIDGFDLIPDVLGWLLVLVGLMPLAGRSPGFAAAAVASAAGALLALPLQLDEPGLVLGLLEAATQTVLVFGTCTGLRAVVAEPRVRQTADRIRWADLTLAGLGAAIGLVAGRGAGGGQVDGAAVVTLLVLLVATLAVAVWFLVFLWSQRARPELLSGPGTADGLEPGTP